MAQSAKELCIITPGHYSYRHPEPCSTVHNFTASAAIEVYITVECELNIYEEQ